MRISFLIAGVSIAIVAIVLVNYWPEVREFAGFPEIEETAESTIEAVQPSPVPVAEPPLPQPVAGHTDDTPTVVATEPTVPEVALPELAASDAFVREQLAVWLLPDVWLQRKDLVARAGSLLTNAAAGNVPHRQLAHMTPGAAFPVTQVGDLYFLDRRGEQRYDHYVDVLTALPAPQAVAIFTRLSPLLDQGLKQLGEQQTAHQLLLQAIETAQLRASQLPVLAAEVALLQPDVMYVYADPALESLPDMDKLMLRLGPENLSKLMAYLAEIKELL